MIPAVDIFSLILGALYSFLAPIIAYLIGRRRLGLKLRDLALGVLGALLLIALSLLLAILLMEIGFAESSSPARTALYSLAVGAPLNGAICFVLLRFAASRSPGWAPAVGYGIGFGAFYAIAITGWTQVHDLRLALAVNAIGADSVFYRAAAAERFADNAFSYGLPSGVTGITRLMIEIGVAMLAWRGVCARDWKWVAAAIFLDAGSRLPAILLDGLDLPVTGNDYYLLLGLAIISALLFAGPWTGSLRDVANHPGEVRADASRDESRAPTGLLATWRNQNRPGASDEDG
jgi:uncharacterized membrane protein YhfC